MLVVVTLVLIAGAARFVSSASIGLCTACATAVSQPHASICRQSNLTVIDACCWRNDSTKTHPILAGLLLHNCNLDQFDPQIDIAYDNVTIAFIAHQLIILDISGNPLTTDLNDDHFRHMTSLDTLLLPRSSARSHCPGGSAAWLTTSASEDTLECKTQTSTCTRLNVSCSENGRCDDDGPGLAQCQCKPNYYGYKCAKKQDTFFPTLQFFATVSISTLALSLILWYTQRRHIRPKQHES